VVGRVAVVISKLLQGKNKPIYHPAVDMGDHVVVTNTRHLAFSGNKWNQKLYRHHTGYPGGLKEVLAKELHAKSPNKVLYKAVQGMLPKNNLRKYRMRRLHLFPDEDFPYQANITHKLSEVAPVGRKMADYSAEEVAKFPKLFNIPHL
jgi:large subunit ribosomal protein L13